MYKALIIGCGNIGAMYDLHKPDVLTHAKAYSKHPEFLFSIYDTNNELAAEVAQAYHVDREAEVDIKTLSAYDCVSICSPTATHAQYLELCLNAKVPVIICEKPIAYNQQHILSIDTLYGRANSKILVNYIRRFQESYIQLKELIKNIQSNEPLLHIHIKYQRGFLNNASHAFDLLCFLLQKKLSVHELSINHYVADHFENDPTCSMFFNWQTCQVHVTGLSEIGYSLFEIDLYFKQTRVSILDSGNCIKVYEAPVGDRYAIPLKINEQKSAVDCLKDYMLPVIQSACQLLKNPLQPDNYLEASELNQQLLLISKQIYGKTSN